MLGKFDGNENYSSLNLLTFNKLQKQPPNVFYERNYKKLFLKTSQDSQENTFLGVFVE